MSVGTVEINFSHCLVKSEDSVIMLSETVPTIDTSKNMIKFGRMSIKDCFYGKYLGEDLELHFYEKKSDTPTIRFIAGIISYGPVSIRNYKDGKIVDVKDFIVEYISVEDSLNRIVVQDLEEDLPPEPPPPPKSFSRIDIRPGDLVRRKNGQKLKSYSTGVVDFVTKTGCYVILPDKSSYYVDAKELEIVNRTMNLI